MMQALTRSDTLSERAAVDSTNRPENSVRHRLSRVPLWLIAFVGFFLLGAGWGFASPYDGGPDEQSHIIKAAGVYWDGPLPKPVDAWRGTGTIQHVPAVFSDGDMSGKSSPRVPSVAYTGRYNVTYYAIVGLPLRIWPNWIGLYIARLLTSLMIAGLLAAAVAATCRSRYRLLAGVFVAIAPITMHLAGTVNPNGVEIAAGLLLGASLIPALFESDGPLPRTVLWQSGTAAAVLALVRVLGPLWLVITLGVLLFPFDRPIRDRLRRTPGIRYWTGGVGLAVLLGVAWTIVFKAYVLLFTNGVGNNYTLPQVLRLEVVVRWNKFTEEMVGVLGSTNIHIPGPFYLIWYLLLGLFVLGAMVLGNWADRFRVLALLAATYLVPTVAEIQTVNKLGFQTQGRYLLPLMVTVLMLATHVIARRLPDDRAAISLTRTVAVITLPIQLIFLWFTMVWWQHGGFPAEMSRLPLNALHGHWHPPVGSGTPLILALLGAVALLALAWHAGPARTPYS
jgi:hypothetical protein